MPDQKLSQLTAATPLTGAELVYVVQSGNQRRTTAADVAGLAAATNLSYDAATRTLSSSTGADVVLPEATTTLAGLMAAASLVKLNSIIVDRAQLTVAEVRNNSGVAIPKGAPVYVTGSSGTVKTVALADASTEATAANTIGIALDAISHNSNGFIVTEGLLSGVDTSTLTEGQMTWLSETTGAITTTRPTQPAHGVHLGWCVKQAAGSAGILYIKVDNGYELDELHDVLIVGATTGQVLRRAADGLWKNATLTAGDVGADAAGTATASMSAHTGAANPHSQYALSSGLGNSATRNVGTTAGTVAAGDDARFHAAVTLAASVADVLNLSGQELQADDPGGDRLLFWDDSEGKLTHATLGPGITLVGTTVASEYVLGIACSDEISDLTAGTAKVTFRMPFAANLIGVRSNVNTAPTGATLVVDLNEAGTSVLSTKLSIDATEKTSVTAAVPAVISDAVLADDAEMTIDIDQVGATAKGKGLKVWLYLRRTG